MINHGPTPYGMLSSLFFPFVEAWRGYPLDFEGYASAIAEAPEKYARHCFYALFYFVMTLKNAIFAENKHVMAKQKKWSDEYWLVLMQLYLKKPVGVKPLYSRPLIDIALELHIHPKVLYEKLFSLRKIDTPMIERLWKTYSKSPKKLSKEVNLLREMNGFGRAEHFYDGVEVAESWEKDFKPISEEPDITPVKLIMVLDLYFRLTPITMVPETPEIVSLAKTIHLTPRKVCDIMDVFQILDPYLNRSEMIISPLLVPCKDIWQRFGNGNPDRLAALAAQLKDYFKK